ncbi:MAG: hypothetical protein M0T70_02755 [Geobacteraceae bacterium]|nr:hypothetical protein [Geobacteraceae bacterium]
MSKRREKTDTNQLSLLDLLQRTKEMQLTPSTRGSMNIEASLRRSLSEGIKQCPLDAYQIAGEMSHLLDETITAEMIYSWTAESKTRHQIWGSRLAAFCRVTNWRQPLEIVNESAGMFCLPGAEALRSEIQKLREEEQKAARERKKRELFLQEMEGKK